MSKRIAINGFGRIGRLAVRNLLLRSNVQVVAINDLTDNATLAHLFKYDSSQGPFEGEVSSDDKFIYVNGKKIHASAERDPAQLPWKELGIDVVLECTGIFRSKDKVELHINAGAKKVIISAPAKGAGIQTVVLGVNDDQIDWSQKIFDNASCTTNCLAPVAKIVHDNWGIKVGSMTTTHAYTADQNLQDAPHKDLRRARAAAINIVPTDTGAATAVGKVIPAVAGRLSAIALRVPVSSGSMIELNCLVEKNTTIAEINSVFKQKAEGPLKGILQYVEDPIVSSDILRNPHSSIFDALMTDVLQDNFIKVVSWYDNEAGYAARLADLAMKV